ncbi:MULTISPECIES: aminodeoxychorismate synthase component I [Cupriavidus]|jgi:para-aminobenzoate synthetase / 4-amino-4-deoxychorismate lyase|uniref:aminodeoxychorismate synthase component I n=1 Tax=Cupriavidus TaxID=106589 RepID=UPI00076385A9|nr:aminodeoxychorismate synthase component I [Cupriavidus metallidurans]KWW34680.1 Aminodeoxychorismate synthase component 1 [Cupriavidus metallidurans]
MPTAAFSHPVFVVPIPSPPFVLLDDATAGSGVTASRLYTDFVREDVLAAGADVSALDTLLASGWRDGLHATFFAPYEFGGAIVGAPVHVGDALPFHDGALRVLWFRTLRRLDTEGVAQWLAAGAQPGPTGALDVTASTTRTQYTEAIARIHDYIEAGDTYQVNFTQRLRCRVFGDPMAFYAALRAAQPVPFGVLAHLPGGGWVLSLSPELFVEHDGHGHLVARPMKGTAPRSGDAEQDARAAKRLATDAKNRAENVMIVDLLRNDLGRVAIPGSVAVPERFVVEPFGRVLQMTSTVTATARPGTSFGALMAALFPCGSITGAPKRRTMQIIAELETSPRGLYTGAIGWLDATSHKTTEVIGVGAFGMSVAIRTLVLAPPGADGLRAAEMGVGGGIVHDSVADDEYAECGWKARFLIGHDPGFTLFETMHARDGAVLHRERHLQRLANSSAAFGFALDLPEARAAVLAEAARLGDGDWRLRVSVDQRGTLVFASGALAPLAHGVVGLEIAPTCLPVHDPLRRHKLSARAVFDQGWQAAERAGGFDSLFFNTCDELLEGGRSSVFIKVDGHWMTPPLSADILPGVMRAVVLEEGDALIDGPVQEATVTRDMVQRAEAIVIANALRGTLRARLI